MTALATIRPAADLAAREHQIGTALERLAAASGATLREAVKDVPSFAKVLEGLVGDDERWQLDWLQALGNRASLVRPCDWEPWIVPLLTGKDPGHAAPTLQWDGDTWTGTLATWAATKHTRQVH